MHGDGCRARTAHHQGEVGTTLGNNLVTLVGQVGNANAGSDLSWGHYMILGVGKVGEGGERKGTGFKEMNKRGEMGGWRVEGIGEDRGAKRMRMGWM